MRFAIPSLVLSLGMGCASAQLFAPRLYDATTETGLPHLEENLRYATTHAKLCLGPQQLATAFPILRHEALKGCKLDHERRTGESIQFDLSCAAPSETTGSALWQLDELGIRGTLDVRFGGKNMTMYQRISGKPMGACTPGD
jgi:hypothetical protein